MNKSISTLIDQFRRLVRFASVGLLSTLVYSVLYAAIKESFNLSILVTTIVAFGSAMVVSFLGHKYFTFRTKGNLSGQVIRYLIVYVCGLIVAYYVMEICTNVYKLHYILGILAVDIVVPAVTFVLMLIFVFADRSVALVKPSSEPEHPPVSAQQSSSVGRDI